MATSLFKLASCGNWKAAPRTAKPTIWPATPVNSSGRRPIRSSNHLDLARLAVLENWVNFATEGVAMLIASHDRQFLDACTQRTLFLRPEDSRLYAHPFGVARALLADDDAARAAGDACPRGQKAVSTRSLMPVWQRSSV